MATTISGTSANNTLTATSAGDTLLGFAGNDTLIGSTGDEWLDGGLGIDSMTGGAGNDTYIVDNAADVVVELSADTGTDTIQSLVSYTLAANVENLVLLGTAAINGTGNSLANTLTGNSGNNRLEGGINAVSTDKDTLIGGDGDDVYVIRAITDVIDESSSSGTDTAEIWVNGYTVDDHVENIQLMGGANLTVTGNAQNNKLTGNSGQSTLNGGAGDDTFIVNASTGGDDIIDGGAGTDTVETSVTYTLTGTNVEKLTLTGTAAIDGSAAGLTAAVTLTGNRANNRLTGGTLADNLIGDLGNDTLDGGAGADSMVGGAGNDTYVVNVTDDVVTEQAGQGIDTVEAGDTFTLSDNIENLVLTGTAVINGTGNGENNRITGNSAVNTLTGNAGNDILDGGAGADIMVGGAGNDTYVVDVSTETVTEAAGEGTDTVQASVDFNLLTHGANVENLVLTGTAAINGTGNGLANQITGNSAANTLDGGTGADTMDGGLGDDTYVVDDVGDRVTESLRNGGVDTVQSTVSYTLGANLENLKLTGAGLTGTGNTLANALTGGNDSQTLNGGTNADTMTGGAGDDTYYVDNAGDVVLELASQGTDTIKTSLNNASLRNYANVENLELIGSARVGFGDDAVNILTGNAQANTLDGGGGADTMVGGAGNDTYVVDVSTETVTEAAGEGIDTVQASVNYTLGTDVENLVLTGTAAINGTGNGGNNRITGNSVANSLLGGGGDDTLDGGGSSASADTLDGGDGSDVYIVKVGYTAPTITITDTGITGTDTVQSAITFTLTSGDGVENLTLTGIAAINGTGNGLDNTLTGNRAANTLAGGDGADTLDGGAGHDTLDGGKGNDSMVGGAGNDTFKVDSAADTAVGGAGIDTVEVEVPSAVAGTFTYTLGADVEHLRMLSANALAGTGNALANRLTGNAGNDTLDGGAGVDTLNGGAGNDTYIVDNVRDVVIDSSGTDEVQASISYTLGAGIEKLTLLTPATGSANIGGTGNDLANTLTGNAGANTLDGGAGADTMAGGAGNDTYVVDVSTETVTEVAGEGTDTVQASVDFDLSTHGANVENLVLTGSDAINGTGNDLDNTLTGNSAANVLQGGQGNDTYIIDASDTVMDTGGTDTVQANFSYVLADEIENLILAPGNLAINGTGNSGDNSLTGNAAANVLDGGAGADAMAGGAGNDVYHVDNAGDVVTEDVAKGIDWVHASVDYTLASAANVEHLTLVGLALSGTGNLLANRLTGNDEANILTGDAGNDTLDGGVGSDTLNGGTGSDVYVVDDEADVVVDVNDAGKDTVQASVSYTLGDFVENLTLTGSADIDATGNELANTLTGNIGANRLDGGAGADAMDGGLGDDTYVVDDVKDKVVEASATGGDDTIETSISWVAAANIENLVLTGEDHINATGNKSDNMLLGNSGDNVLKGDAGADFMAGGAGDDTYEIDGSDTIFEEAGEGTDTVMANFSYKLDDGFENLVLTSKTADNATGNGEDNELTGNSMANTLNGKAGNDTLTGGLGNDIFRFDTDLLSNTDTIQDFVVGQDRISLENSIFKGLALGKLKAANFALGTAAADANDYIIYDTATGNLWYDADGAGGGSAQQFATLVGVDEAPALTAASFIVT